MPLAYGYVRWSSDQQEAGSTAERQTELIGNWLKRNAGRVKLDTSLAHSGIFRDEGKSAFIRESLDGYELGDLLKHCQSGRIRPGSFIVTENNDRLSREHPWDALLLIDSFLKCGVVVVILSPEKEYRDRLDATEIIMATMNAERAYQDSAKKRDRIGKGWKTLKEGAAEKVMFSKVPNWCRVVGQQRSGNKITVRGRIEEIPERGEVVRRCFRLAADGFSLAKIADALNADKVKPFNKRCPLWAGDMVAMMLKSRAVMGEYQPMKGRGKNRVKDGDVNKNYYPAVVTEDLFHAAQVGLDSRRTYGRGRRPKKGRPNLFSGLLWDVRTDSRMVYRSAEGRQPTILPSAARRTRGKFSVFNARVFEAAMLKELTELKASDVMPGKDASKVERLAGQRLEQEAIVKELAAQLKEFPATAKRVMPILAAEELKLESLTEKLADAQREAASPLSEQFGEMKKLAALAETDEQRTRLAAALQRIIDRVTVLFVGKGKSRQRIAVVEITFKGGARRYIDITHLQPGFKSPEWWGSESLRTDAPRDKGLKELAAAIEKDILDHWDDE